MLYRMSSKPLMHVMINEQNWPAGPVRMQHCEVGMEGLGACTL